VEADRNRGNFANKSHQWGFACVSGRKIRALGKSSNCVVNLINTSLECNSLTAFSDSR
jgi:hypothetical protein